MSVNIARDGRRRVVIIGGGIGGLKLAERLRRSDFQVILFDRNNYHQFPPLIYQVASAGMDPGSICFPFRNLFKHGGNIRFRMGELREIYPDHHLIQTSIGKVEYDELILAAGATTNFYGNANVAAEAIPMKTVEEAMGLQNALLSNLERSATCATQEEQQELLNIVIVGGGATGVEIAGAIAEMKRMVLPKDYPDIDASKMHIYLIEAADRLLRAFSPESSADVERFLRKMGVEVLLNRPVTDYSHHCVTLSDGTRIPTRSFIWVSGISAEPVGNLDKALTGRGGRIRVDAFNRVPGLEDVWSIGDQCIMEGDAAYAAGHPQVAQVAIQQAECLAANLRRKAGGEPLQPFRYKDLGSMATVGRNKAVAEIGGWQFKGFFAWLLWLLIHLRSILGVRNKLLVLFNWMWSYFTYNRSQRMIFMPKKPKVLRDRAAREAVTHLGDELLRNDTHPEEEENEKDAAGKDADATAPENSSDATAFAKNTDTAATLKDSDAGAPEAGHII